MSMTKDEHEQRDNDLILEGVGKAVDSVNTVADLFIRAMVAHGDTPFGNCHMSRAMVENPQLLAVVVPSDFDLVQVALIGKNSDIDLSPLDDFEVECEKNIYSLREYDSVYYVNVLENYRPKEDVSGKGAVDG